MLQLLYKLMKNASIKTDLDSSTSTSTSSSARSTSLMKPFVSAADVGFWASLSVDGVSSTLADVDSFKSSSFSGGVGCISGLSDAFPDVPFKHRMTGRLSSCSRVGWLRTGKEMRSKKWNFCVKFTTSSNLSFCGTSVSIASIRWVRLTFSSLSPFYS